MAGDGKGRAHTSGGGEEEVRGLLSGRELLLIARVVGGEGGHGGAVVIRVVGLIVSRR